MALGDQAQGKHPVRGVGRRSRWWAAPRPGNARRGGVPIQGRCQGGSRSPLSPIVSSKGLSAVAFRGQGPWPPESLLWAISVLGLKIRHASALRNHPELCRDHLPINYPGAVPSVIAELKGLWEKDFWGEMAEMHFSRPHRSELLVIRACLTSSSDL